MARTLYRIYLYVVVLGMLVLAAVGMALLLSVLLGQTPLRGTANPAPARIDVIQKVTFALVSWVIAALVGGFHYRLIRRDITNDATAGTGATRAFFLNAAEAVAAVVTVTLVSSTISQLAFQDARTWFNAADAFAAAAAALGAGMLLEWERRRTPDPAPGAALVFQRLNFAGVPLLMVLLNLTAVWQSALSQSVIAVLSGRGLYNPCPVFPPEKAGTPPVCTPPNLGVLWLSALVVAGAWLGYGLLARGDPRSTLRQVVHLLGLGYGVVFVVVGVDRGIELLLRAILRAPASWGDVATSLDFISPTVFGLLILVVYGRWLRQEAAAVPMGAENATMTAEALVAGILAVPFWWGMGVTLHDFLERGVPAGARPTAADFAASLALLITGAASIPIALRLRQRSIETAKTGPRRAFVLAALAAGAITGAIGAAIALYALGTALLSAPIADWQQVARTGLVALVVGAAMATIYGVAASREHFFGPPRLQRHPMPAVPAPPPEPAHDAIDDVLDELAAGRLTHDEAAARLRELIHTGA